MNKWTNSLSKKPRFMPKLFNWLKKQYLQSACKQKKTWNLKKKFIDLLTSNSFKKSLAVT